MTCCGMVLKGSEECVFFVNVNNLVALSTRLNVVAPFRGLQISTVCTTGSSIAIILFVLISRIHALMTLLVGCDVVSFLVEGFCLLQRNEPCCIGFSPESSQDGPAEDANSFHYVDLRLFDTWFPHPVRICSKYGCPSQNVLSPEATSVGSQAVNCPKLQMEVPEIRLLSGWCATHLGSTNNPSGCPANWTTAYERQPKSSLSSWWNENNGRRHLLRILYS